MKRYNNILTLRINLGPPQGIYFGQHYFKGHFFFFQVFRHHSLGVYQAWQALTKSLSVWFLWRYAQLKEVSSQSLYPLHVEMMAACCSTSGKHRLHHIPVSLIFSFFYLRRNVSLWRKKTASGQIKRQVNALTRNPISIVDYQRPFHKALNRQYLVQQPF